MSIEIAENPSTAVEIHQRRQNRAVIRPVFPVGDSGQPARELFSGNESIPHERDIPGFRKLGNPAGEVLASLLRRTILERREAQRRELTQKLFYLRVQRHVFLPEQGPGTKR